MKRIMYKKVYQAAMAALMLTAATACTGDNDPMQDNNTPQAGRLLTVTATQPGADTQTRTDHQDNGTTVDVNWKENDVIYIGEENTVTSLVPLTEAGFASYTLETGADSKNATFISTSPLQNLKENTTIHAFYGKATQLKTDLQRVIVDSNDQRQTTNESMAHLADYDFMYATGTYKQGRIINFEFKHQFSLLKLNLTLPSKGITVKKLTLQSKGTASFVNSLDVNLSNQFATKGCGSFMNLNLGADDSGFTCTDNELIAYMMMRYDDDEEDFTITVTDVNNKEYVSGTLTGSKTAEGKFYILTATLTESNSN